MQWEPHTVKQFGWSILAPERERERESDEKDDKRRNKDKWREKEEEEWRGITDAAKILSSRLCASSVGLSGGLSYRSYHQEEVSLTQTMHMALL